VKIQLVTAALLATTVMAGPGLAQGTFSSGAPKSTWNNGPAPRAPGYTPYVPQAPVAPRPSMTPRTYGSPQASTPAPFKPYEPYRIHPGTSLFGPDGKPKR